MSTSTYQANDGPAYERFIGRWSRRVADRIAQTVPMPGNGALLDVGCGTGSVTAALAARYPGARWWAWMWPSLILPLPAPVPTSRG